VHERCAKKPSWHFSWIGEVHLKELQADVDAEKDHQPGQHQGSAGTNSQEGFDAPCGLAEGLHNTPAWSRKYEKMVKKGQSWAVYSECHRKKVGKKKH